MAHHAVKIGDADSHALVGNVGHGLMMMMFKPTPVPDEDAFTAIKIGMNVMNLGASSTDKASLANLELVARFFDKYLQYADRAFLSVKGGLVPGGVNVDGSRENLRRSVDNILKTLRGTKKLDLFQPARRDPNYEIEHYTEVLNEMIEEGKFDYIGLSEVGAETVRRAHKVMPVAAVEIEVSLQAYEHQTKDVIATCKELEIAVVAYSPLGRGLLTGQIKSRHDFEGAFRRDYDRFQDDNIGHNLQLMKAVTDLASYVGEGITAAQLSIAWVGALGSHVIPLPGSSNVKHTLQILDAGEVELEPEELAEIAKLLEKYPRKGARYVDGVEEDKWVLRN